MEVITPKAPYKLTFEEPPLSNFRNEFAEFIRQTLRPEDYPGICITQPPDKLNGAVMVHRFDLRGSKRTNPRIHCTMCNRKDQFLSGALYWFPQDRHVRLIGNCCARAHDAENFESANNALTWKERYERDCEFLEKNLYHAPLLLATVSELIPLCEKIMCDRNQFKMMRGFLSEMKKSNKIGGKLNIEVLIHKGEVYKFLESEGAADKSDYRVQTVHILEGFEYIDPCFDPQKNCHTIISFFQGLVPPQAGSYDAMLLELVDDEKAIVKLAGDYRCAVGNLRSLHQFLQKAVRFLSGHNLSGLKSFGADRHTHFPFGLTFNDDDAHFEMRDRGTDYIFKRGAAIIVPAITLPETV